MKGTSRREFIGTVAAAGAHVGLSSLAAGAPLLRTAETQPSVDTPAVSIVRIKRGDTDSAVRQAIDLLGGMGFITQGKERILLKPNLVDADIRDVTKPDVVKSLARLMIESGKDVSIGEGSGAATSKVASTIDEAPCRVTDTETLDAIQSRVFDTLGYSELAKDLRIPLVNLHTGSLATVPLPQGFVFKELSLHQSLVDTDLLCSVPMMKTHGLATVTLGMKNLFGAFPGTVYGAPRWAVHRQAGELERTGTAAAIVDMVQANKLGLTVIDASTAMQGTGPIARGGGRLARMNLIIAGLNPLATDMVAAFTMGFQPEEIPTFTWAWKAGMTPASLDHIEIRGERLRDVRQRFARPLVMPWSIVEDLIGEC